MAIASLAQRTTTLTTGSACVEWIAGAGSRPRILEICLIPTSSNVQLYGLARSSTIGVTPVGVTFLPEDAGDPTPLTKGSLSAATSPIASSIYIRKFLSLATGGLGVMWTFPRGLPIEPNGSIGLFNLITGTAMDIWCVVNE